MNGRKIILGLFVIAAAVSCSTTRSLSDGEYRLAKNIVQADDPAFRTSQLSSYIRQKPNSSLIGDWNPFLSIYNWSGHKSGGIACFFRKIGEQPVVYNPAMVDESIRNMETHLTYLGYYGSTVDSRIEVKGRKVYVYYYVTLGRRYKIRSVDFDIPSYGSFAEDYEKDRKNVTIKPGDWLSESLLESESDRSARYFRSIGYYGFDKRFFFFEADTLQSPGEADLNIAIRDYGRDDNPANAVSHEKFSIGRVRVSHPENVRIRPSIISNLNVLKPGELYSEDKVNLAYTRLSNLSVFNSINITTTPREGHLVDCDINMTTGGIQGFKANLEASVNSTGLFGISPQVNYFHRNIFRGGEQLNLSVKGNFQFKPKSDIRSDEISVSSRLRFPKFIGLPNRVFKSQNIPRTDISLSFSYQDRPEYRRTIISAAFGYTGILWQKFNYQFYPFQGNIVRLFDMSDDFLFRTLESPFLSNAYSDHFDLGIGGILYFTTDPSPIPSSSFRYYRLSFDLSGNLLSLFNSAMPTNEDGYHTIWETPYSQYVRAEFQFAQTLRFGRDEKHAFAWRLLAGAGYAYGNSTSMPFEKQFYAGGANSMRGWQARALGPGAQKPIFSFTIPSQTGEMKLEANVEYRFPLFWKLEGALFADAGNIWDIQDWTEGNLELEELLGRSCFRFDSQLPESVALDWGVGIRLNLNFLVARLDMGMRLHDPQRDRGDRWVGPGKWFPDNYAIHFGVGYPF